MQSPPPAVSATSPLPATPRSGSAAGGGPRRGSLDEPRRSVQTNRNAEWMSQVRRRGERGRGGRGEGISPTLPPSPPLVFFPQREGAATPGAGRTLPPHTRLSSSSPLSLLSIFPKTVAWTFLSVILLLTWLAASAALGDAPGPAWTLVHLAHAAVSFYLLHWAKGSPVPADQGKYDTLTFWEQVRGVEGVGGRWG